MENWKIKSFPNIFKIFDKMWENDSSSGGFYIAASMEYNRIVMMRETRNMTMRNLRKRLSSSEFLDVWETFEDNERVMSTGKPHPRKTRLNAAWLEDSEDNDAQLQHLQDSMIEDFFGEGLTHHLFDQR